MRPVFLLHRLAAALLVLTLVWPAAVMCRPASRADRGAMSGMSCCTKPAPAETGSFEQDCCRVSERVPGSTPAAPPPPRVTVSADDAPVLVAGATLIPCDTARAHHDWQSARGRPHGPAHFLSSALLV